MNTQRQTSITILIGIAAAIIASSPAHAENPKKHRIDIDAQDLGGALMELGVQTRNNVLYIDDDVEGKTSKGVEGVYTKDEAIEILLDSSGVQYRQNVDGTLLVGDAMIARANTDGDNLDGAVQVSQAERRDSATEGSADPEDSEVREVDASELDEIVVVATGTRLKGVPSSAPVLVFDRAELAKRGLTTLEEVIRYLPQNFSTVTSGGEFDAQNTRLGSGFEGASTANLRGLGDGATLILINGKRIPESPGGSFSFTDLSTIPMGAVERIEILTDGASAVYGSDAIAGVINIILKSDFAGADTRLRFEGSSSGGDRLLFEQTAGKSWGSGNITASFSYESEDTVETSSAGLITDGDFTSQGGRVFRNIEGRPATITGGFPGAFLPGSPPPGAFLAVIPPSDGVTVDLSAIEYVTFGEFFTQSGNYSALPAGSFLLANNVTPDVERFSGHISFEQELSERLTFNASGFYTERETLLGGPLAGLSGTVAPTQAYNPFGAPVSIFYSLAAEAENGLAKPVDLDATTTRYSISPSLTYDFDFRDWSAELAVTYGEDENDSKRLNQLNAFSPEVLALFSDPDPNTAINFFGDGTTNIRDITGLQTGAVDNGSKDSTQTVYSVIASGGLFDLPGGEVKMSVGGEIREDTIDFSDSSSAGSLLIDDPSTDNIGVFAEMSLPVIGENNASSFAKSLTFVFAGRYDDYSIKGPFDGIGEPASERNYDAFTARVGLAWYPTEGFKFRMSWGEVFQEPQLQALFNPFVPPESQAFPLIPVNDPFAPGGPAVVFVPIESGGNPDLQPQEATTFTIGFDYTPETLDGLSVSVTWTDIDFENIISSPLRLVATGSPNDLVALSDILPGVVERDAAGNLTLLNLSSQNLSSRKSKSLDLSIQYEIDTSYGVFAPGVLATRNFELEFQAVEGASAPAFDLLRTERGPPWWNVNGFIDWRRNNWSVNTTVRHTSGYTNTNPFALVTEVDGYTTVDLRVAYEIEKWNAQISAGAENAFDADFPFFDSDRGVNSATVDFRRRIWFVEASKEFSF